MTRTCITFLYLIGNLVHGFGDLCHIRSDDFLQNCTCKRLNRTMQLYTVNCSRTNLSIIPKMSNIAQELVLKDNKISLIKDGVFSTCSGLRSLDLSNNHIQNISRLAFQGLENLVHLNLANNKINSGSFGYNIFIFLKNLTSLNLKYNLLGSFQPNLSSLTSLKFLKMDFVMSDRLGNLGKQFAGLKNLQHLDISGLTGRCNVAYLTSNSFNNIVNLRHLDVSGCKLQSIHNNTFSKLINLRLLDISYNRCLKFNILENVTHDLQFTHIQIFKMNRIHNVFDMNNVLKIVHVRYFYYTFIEEIHIDSNRIQQIEKGALSYLPSTLKFISAKDNEFSFGNYLIDLLRLSITKIDISNLNTFHQGGENDEKCEFAEGCFTSNNFLSTRHSIDHVRTFQYVYEFPKNLETIYYRSCRSVFDSFPEYNIPDNRLEHVDFSNNVFGGFIGPVRNAKHLTYLDLSSNHCSNISKNFFSADFIKLKELYLQNNMLGTALQDDKDGETFQHLHALEKMNLSQNGISNLPKGLFSFQRNLRFLDLSNNLIVNVSFDLQHMHQLSYLDLGNNRISVLNSDLRGQLDAIVNSKHNLSVYLGGNPMLCTCKTLDFVEWIAITSVHLINRNSYTCQFSNLTQTSLGNPGELYRNMKKSCVSYQTIILVIVSAILFFFFIIGSGLTYRYRWKLRYIYYMIKIRSHKRTSAIDSEDPQKYLFGAFVSYADEDRKFVHEKFLRKIEHENSISLCLHKRNFLPGNDIATNITSAIHNSRKTVIIMSRNFLKSHWCMFEYNMSRMESIYERNGENMLFLVFIEQMTSRDLPLYVLELVQSQSYIEYPNDEYGDAVFWDQIIKALTK